ALEVVAVSSLYAFINVTTSACLCVLQDGSSLFCFLSSLGAPRDLPFSLHDALPIYQADFANMILQPGLAMQSQADVGQRADRNRSEEHTSALQSREKLVCRLLPEKKQHSPRAGR